MSGLNIGNLFGSIGGNLGFGGLSLDTALRFIAEPASRFSAYISSLSGSTPSMMASNKAAGNFDVQIAQLEALMNKQQELQMQMQAISCVTNIMKTDHDMHMAVIRNLKVD